MLSQKELLDQLMEKTHWSDPEVCRKYLCGFCPKMMFANTKSDIGSCFKLHEDSLREEFQKEPAAVREKYEIRFLDHLIGLCEDVDRKIVKARTRLSLEMAPDSSNPEVAKRLERISEINEEIKKLTQKMEELGEDGKVEESAKLFKVVESLQTEKLTLQNMNTPVIAMQSNEKQMVVCDVCGAFLVQNDVEHRTLSHLTGKQHSGYQNIRDTIRELKAVHGDKKPTRSVSKSSGSRHSSASRRSGERRSRHSSHRSRSSRGSYSESRRRSRSRSTRRGERERDRDSHRRRHRSSRDEDGHRHRRHRHHRSRDEDSHHRHHRHSSSSHRSSRR